MADGATIKIRRKDELLAKLKRLAPETEKELTKANGTTANEMVAIARGLAPKRTGKLAASIVATPPGGSPPGYAQGGGVVPPGAYAVTAGNTAVRYAHLVEFGTAPHTIGGIYEGAEHPGTAAQPFFYPAYRLMRKKHKGRATRAINKASKAVAK